MSGESGTGHARELVTLLHDYGDRWTITCRPGGLSVYTAEQHNGTEVRYLVGRTVEELHDKLETAETAES